MKYLKLFESEKTLTMRRILDRRKKEDDLISEIKEIFYIMEDEGYEIQILNNKQHMYLNIRDVGLYSVAELTKQKNEGRNNLYIYIHYKSEYKRSENTDEFIEFKDRVEEISKKYNYSTTMKEVHQPTIILEIKPN